MARGADGERYFSLGAKACSSIPPRRVWENKRKYRAKCNSQTTRKTLTVNLTSIPPRFYLTENIHS